MSYICENCGDFVDQVYINLFTGEYLCPNCYHDEGLDDNEDFDVE